MIARLPGRSLPLFSVLLSSFLLCTARPAIAAPDYGDIALKIALACKTQNIKKIAVMPFPYADKRVSGGSGIVSERLTTLIVGKEGIEVVERNLLDKVVDELKLGVSGMIDANTAYELGKILNVDAIVTGTLIDLPKRKVEINARLIKVVNGQILGVATGKVAKEWYDDASPDRSDSKGSGSAAPNAASEASAPAASAPAPQAAAKSEQEWELIGLKNISKPAEKATKGMIKEKYNDLLGFLQDKQADKALTAAQWVYLHARPERPFYVAGAMVCYGEALEIVGRSDEAKKIYSHVMTKYPFEKKARQRAAVRYASLTN